MDVDEERGEGAPGEEARRAERPREGRPAYRIDFTACRVVRVAPEPRKAAEPDPALLP